MAGIATSSEQPQQLPLLPFADRFGLSPGILNQAFHHVPVRPFPQLSAHIAPANEGHWTGPRLLDRAADPVGKVTGTLQRAPTELSIQQNTEGRITPRPLIHCLQGA